MWDAEITPEREAWSERGVDPAGPEHAAFYANVGRLRATGSLHDRTIDVVADPLQPAIPLWRTGHSLAEGIGRPSGTAKQAHRDLLDDLVQLFAT